MNTCVENTGKFGRPEIHRKLLFPFPCIAKGAYGKKPAYRDAHMFETLFKVGLPKIYRNRYFPTASGIRQAPNGREPLHGAEVDKRRCLVGSRVLGGRGGGSAAVAVTPCKNND